jgi:hypothetical protein
MAAKSQATEVTNNEWRNGVTMDERVLEQKSVNEARTEEIVETWCTTECNACRMEEELVEIL